MRTLLACLVGAITLCAADFPEWPQFGGPHRNFTADTAKLPASWPAEGPKKLWTRPLGEGYSGIAIDNGTLYTMYRTRDNEVVVALNAATGKTLWEHSYPASTSGLALENGPGPHATPLVLGDRVYTVGILAMMHAFEKKSGKLLWAKDLYKDFPGATKMGRGYACSPMAYKNTIILQVGGSGHALVALNPADGSLVWGKNDFGNAPSSPMLINLQGQDQIVAFMDDGGSGQAHGIVAGFDPNNGELLWSHPHKTSWVLNIALTVWGHDGILVISPAYGTVARGLQLSREGGKTKVDELWYNNRMRVHHGTMVRVGPYIYGSSGDFGPAPLMAVNARTGEIKWQERAFSKANFVYAGGKFIVLDEDGGLALATFSAGGVEVLSRTHLLSHNAWTAPSLAGTKLYVRDRSQIMALDVGQ